MFRRRSRVFLILLGLVLAGILLALSVGGASAEDDGWTRQFGTEGRDAATGVAVAGDGSLYVLGWTTLVLPDQTSMGGLRDSFVRKYSQNGNELWIRQFGSEEDDTPEGIALDDQGNLYVVGRVYAHLPDQSNEGLNDAFLRKYDSDGTEIWTRQFGTEERDSARSVVVDGGGSVYVVGETKGAFPGFTHKEAYRAAFVRKYDGDGNELWARQFSTRADDFAKGLAVDGQGNLYVVGSVGSPIGGELPGEVFLGGFSDAFVRKYDGDRNELWTRQFGTGGRDTATDVVAGSGEGVYIVGETNGAFPGQDNLGGEDAFVRKYNSEGNELWTRQFGTSEADEANDVALDGSANVYVVGETDEALPDQTYAGGFGDAFVRKYDGDGAELWTRQFGTEQIDLVDGVDIDDEGNLYLVGLTEGVLPGQISLGGRDAFAIKIADPAPTVSAPTLAPGSATPTPARQDSGGGCTAGPGGGTVYAGWLLLGLLMTGLVLAKSRLV